MLKIYIKRYQKILTKPQNYYFKLKGDIGLQEIAEKASGIISQIKDVQTDTEDLFKHPLQELLGLDKQLRSIRGSLKVEVAKKVELEECIDKE